MTPAGQGRLAKVRDPTLLLAERAERNFSRDELSELTGLSPETIYRLEMRQERNPSLLALQALADFYDVEHLEDVTEDQWPRDRTADWPRSPERFPWFRRRGGAS